MDNNKQPFLLGFGCMRFPLKSGNYADIDEEKVFDMIDYAMKHGVNYYDTAAPYHQGESENTLGRALSRYPRSSYFLADKMSIWMLNSQAEMETFFAEQLRKCRTEYFDYYLVHSITEANFGKIEDLKCFEFLAQKKKAGKIRNLGFSFHDSPAVLEKVLAAHNWDFAQIQLNYLDWELQDARKQYDILVKNNLPVIVMEPLRGGKLVSLCKESIDIFKKADENAGMASWALRYAASLSGILTVLSGMSAMEQVKENVKTMKDFKPLTREEYGVIEKALAAYREAAPVPCSDCKYCMPCPFRVDIPRNFDIYNSYLNDGKNTARLMMHYNGLPKAAGAENCTSCGKCKSSCPQHIDIPKLMAKIKAIVEEVKSPAAPAVK